jgi:hypothetical protein
MERTADRRSLRHPPRPHRAVKIGIRSQTIAFPLKSTLVRFGNPDIICAMSSHLARALIDEEVVAFSCELSDAFTAIRSEKRPKHEVMECTNNFLGVSIG